MNLRKNLLSWFTKLITRMKQLFPGKNAWRGAAFGLFLGGPLVALVFLILESGHISSLDFALLLFFVALPVIFIVGYILTKFLKLLGYIPYIYKLAFLSGGILLILIPTYWIASPGSLIVSAFLIVLTSLSGATIAVLIKGTHHNLKIGQRIIWIFGSAVGLVLTISAIIWAFVLSGPLYSLPEERFTSTSPINLPDPTTIGDYEVMTLSYGSGTHIRQEEYGQNATLITKSVDGTSFIDGWNGLSGWYRTHYWGFDATSLPLNGLVWYPDGDGPFPLVLIVHGNHNMSDISEGGYDYLAELLASRGYIVVSIDENFLNSSLSNLEGGLESENDARAWLLLEHLRIWHTWNMNEQNPFYQLVDINNIALIGHSRGGEAVAIASLYNRLSAYPDDATITFDYDFAIKSVIAIAPTDGQYQSGSRPTEIDEINYLTIQGSADSDVFFFMGAQQFDRINVNEETFKAAVFIHGANHGQFNRSWGHNDLGWPTGWLINLNSVMPAIDQEQITKVLVSSFLEATLRDVDGYREVFMDPASAQEFLPDSVILSQYIDGSTVTLSNFDEDTDVATATLNNSHWEAQGITLWREARPLTKIGQALRQTTFSFVGWDQMVNEGGDPARYQLFFDNPLTVTYESSLTMAFAFSNENPSPRLDTEYIASDFLDFTIMVTDIHGQESSIQLSDITVLHQQDILGYTIEKEPLPSPRNESEIIMDTVLIPFSLFIEKNNLLDISSIAKISFVFDQTDAGVLVIDDIGVLP